MTRAKGGPRPLGGELPAIEPEIARAATLPGAFYGDEQWFARQRELLARAWHLAPIGRQALAPGHVEPWTLLPGCLDEPLVWTSDPAGVRRCLSNVCTHRGRIVVEQAGRAEVLACAYHGRCFGLDGKVRAAPGFTGTTGFPAARDHLGPVATGTWAGFQFAALEPELPFADWIEPVQALAECWGDAALPAAPTLRRDYEFDAHWALYVDNFLEGFHIPWVHPSLQRAIEPERYVTRTFARGSMQAAFARAGEPVLALPQGHPLHGEPVAACWYLLFPCTMLNFYPWGLSVNVVEPRGPHRTRVRHLHYVARPELRDQGAGKDLHTVEMEDQAVVLATQRGVGARLYRGGRYSPAHEPCVHHFHQLLTASLAR